MGILREIIIIFPNMETSHSTIYSTRFPVVPFCTVLFGGLLDRTEYQEEGYPYYSGVAGATRYITERYDPVMYSFALGHNNKQLPGSWVSKPQYG